MGEFFDAERISDLSKVEKSNEKAKSKERQPKYLYRQVKATKIFG